MKHNAIIGIVVAIVIVISAAVVLNYFQNEGTLSLSVADGPVQANLSAVYISFSSIELHSNSTGWVNYSVPSRVMNILGVTVSSPSFLGNITIAAGKYTMLRIFITSVTVEMAGNNFTFHLARPYGFINHQFTVNARSTLSITIEFLLNQCMNMQSKIFTPYIGILIS